MNLPHKENAARPDDRERGDFPDDPRLMQAVQEYLDQLEAGRRPDRSDFLRRFPDLAEPLAECLDGLELVHRAALKEKAAASSHASTSSAVDELIANPLGDYKILREIGRGGMGIVYEAVQLSLGRRVALKVLPLAATFDTKHLRRFQKEAKAAAQLHHTNIVPVYHVGCERSVHFYAMQLIEGESLAVVIRQLRRQLGRPSLDDGSGAFPALPSAGADQPTGSWVQLVPPPRKAAERDTISDVSMALSTHRSSKQVEFFRSSARFILQAAEALEHAHEFGIVHRDIKPGNLLVDVHGRLWITDFGLAQFHADADKTQTGDIPGTLRYMSPEQALGQRVLLDHRTDIYSLGATLYELVTLEPIFPGRNRQELLNAIAHHEPRAPRQIDKDIPVELETVILKAVSKNPADRYSTAEDFAADLRRYLEDKPILARRPSLVDRTRKWMRRHPSVVAAMVLLLVFGVVGFAVSTALIAREQARTQAAYLRERQRAEEADQRFRLAKRSADEMIRFAEEELADNPFLQSLRKRLLESALSYYQEFIEQRRDDPAARAELVWTRDKVKKLLDDLAVLLGAGQFQLLGEPRVLDDLRVSDEQRRRITDLTRHMEAQRQDWFGEFCRLTPEERSQRFLEQAYANEKAVAAILSQDQLRRLGQIALQFQGPAAFRDLEVAAALKLTIEQREKIRAIVADACFGKVDAHGGDATISAAEGARKSRDEVRKASLLQIQSLLTDEQQKRWKEMVGEPYKGPIRGFAPVKFRSYGPPVVR